MHQVTVGKLCDSSQGQRVHLQKDQSHFRGFLGGYDNMMHAECLAWFLARLSNSLLPSDCEKPGGQGGVGKANWRQTECLEVYSKEFGVYPTDMQTGGVGIGGMA